MTLYDEVHTSFRDYAKLTAESTVVFPLGTVPATIAVFTTKVGALTNAALYYQRWEVTTIGPTSDAGADAAYPSRNDWMVLVFDCAGGKQTKHWIPAPKVGAFLPDGETVDPADPDVSAYVSFAIANLKHPDGEAITGLNVGFRETQYSGATEVLGASEYLKRAGWGAEFYAQHGLDVKVDQ